MLNYNIKTSNDFNSELVIKLSDLKTNILLTEANRKELLVKDRKSDKYKADQSKGKNRFERKKHSSIAKHVSQYNKIDMNSFFKKDVLTVNIDVYGETNNYVVTMQFKDILKGIQQIVKSRETKLQFKDILITLTKSFNSGNIYVHCTCADWKYRQAYWATQKDYIANDSKISKENRPSDKTNPNDSKGGGCKHVMLATANVEWIMKVASVINNYIKYTEEHLQKAYGDVIFPAIYGMKYNKAIQLGLFDSDDLNDTEVIDIANALGRERGRYKTGKETAGQMKFKKKETEPKNQQSLFNKKEVEDDEMEKE